MIGEHNQFLLWLKSSLSQYLPISSLKIIKYASWWGHVPQGIENGTNMDDLNRPLPNHPGNLSYKNNNEINSQIFVSDCSEKCIWSFLFCFKGKHKNKLNYSVKTMWAVLIQEELLVFW